MEQLFDRSAVVMMTPTPKPRNRGGGWVSDKVLREEQQLSAALYNALDLDYQNPVVLTGPVIVTAMYLLPRPKALQFQYKDGSWKYPPGLIPHRKVPDVDNLTKRLLDCLATVYASALFAEYSNEAFAGSKSVRTSDLWVTAKKTCMPFFDFSDAQIGQEDCSKGYHEMVDTGLPGWGKPRTLLRVREVTEEYFEEYLLRKAHEIMNPPT